MNTKLTSLFGLPAAALGILLLCSCSSPDEIVTTQKPPEPEEKKTTYHIVVISGFESDPTAEQINGTSFRGHGNSGMFQLKNDLVEKGYDCSFFNWNGTQAGDIHNKLSLIHI